MEAVLQQTVGLQLEHQVIITAHWAGGESVKVTGVCGDPLPWNGNVDGADKMEQWPLKCC